MRTKASKENEKPSDCFGIEWTPLSNECKVCFHENSCITLQRKSRKVIIDKIRSTVPAGFFDEVNFKNIEVDKIVKFCIKRYNQNIPISIVGLKHIIRTKSNCNDERLVELYCKILINDNSLQQYLI